MTEGRSSRRRPRRVALAIALLAIVSLIVPSGRDWWLFALMGGDWPAPKGWPFGEPWRDWDRPTDPRELAAYEYTHALQLPDTLPKPVPFDFNAHLLSSRRQTAAAYFEHLCRTEAGEYIFRKVDKVEAIYQMRPMPRREDRVLRDRYGFEDPADWSGREADGSPMLFIGGPSRGFRVFESLTGPEEIANRWAVEKWSVSSREGRENGRVWRYSDFDYTHGKGYTSGTATPVETISARHAYTWRGVRRERDREFGIAAGELIIVDRVTGEILGVRRSFAIAHQYPSHLDWEFANFCPETLRVDKEQRVMDKTNYPYSFVFQVLDPIDYDPSKMKIF